MAASVSGSTSHGGTGSAWPVSPIPAHELPLIECPDHPDRKFVRFTAQTPANKGRNFFKCMKNARVSSCDSCPTDSVCLFFLGFLFDLGSFHVEARCVHMVHVGGQVL